MKDDPQLAGLLRDNRQECRVPADFQAGVWQEIARRADQPSPMVTWSFWERFRQGLLEPRYGFSLAVLVILIGLALGQIQASVQVRQTWSDLGSEYVASIDPYSQAGHGRH